MKKYTVCCALLLVLPMLLCGCGAGVSGEEDTEPTQTAAAVTAAPTETAAPLPDGVNAHDYNALRAFLETESEGKKNGEKLNAGYDADQPATWTFKRWDETIELAKWDEEGYLIEVNALVETYALAGELDLSGCERLDKVTFSSTSVDTLDLTDCPLMKGVWIQNSSLKKLLPDPIVTPRLFVSDAGLKHLHWIAVPNEELNQNMLDFDLTLDAEGEGFVGVRMSEAIENPAVNIASFDAEGWHFTGWLDENGEAVSDPGPFTYLWFQTPEGKGKAITGVYKYKAVFEEGAPVTEYCSGYEAYTSAVTSLLNGEEADDAAWDISSCDLYFRLDDDALRAYGRVIEHYPETTGGEYVFEYLDPVAEYPREVGEAALKRLYLEIPGEHGWEGWSLGNTAEGFAGEDWFLLKTVDVSIQDTQLACIYVKDGSGWHEFGKGKLPHELTLSGANILNEKVGFISYSCKFLDEPDGSYRRIYLYRTDDGGNTWEDAGLVLPEEYGITYPGCALSPVFKGDHGAMLVNALRLDMPENTPWEELRLKLWYETFDGGRTWILHDEKMK